MGVALLLISTCGADESEHSICGFEVTDVPVLFLGLFGVVSTETFESNSRLLLPCIVTPCNVLRGIWDGAKLLASTCREAEGDDSGIVVAIVLVRLCVDLFVTDDLITIIPAFCKED